MTTAEWATLVPAVVALLGAAAAYLNAQAAHNRLNAHLRNNTDVQNSAQKKL